MNIKIHSFYIFIICIFLTKSFPKKVSSLQKFSNLPVTVLHENGVGFMYPHPIQTDFNHLSNIFLKQDLLLNKNSTNATSIVKIVAPVELDIHPKNSTKSNNVAVYQAAPAPVTIPPLISDLLPFLPLAVYAAQGPIIYVLFASIITNLVLVGVGRGTLSDNLAQAETVLDNINAFAGIPPPAARIEKRKSKLKKKIGYYTPPHLKLQKYNNKLSNLESLILISGVLFIIAKIMDISFTPGLIIAIITSYILYNQNQIYNHNNHNFKKRTGVVTTLSKKSKMYFPNVRVIEITESDKLY